MSISIIIRSKNEEDSIGRVLEGIFSQDMRNDIEVIIVDSGSSDHTLEIARRFDVRIYTIPPEEFTFGSALNKGIRSAHGRIICSLSAHCIPVHNRWLKELTEPLISGQADATIGRQEPVEGMNPFEERVLISMFPPEVRQDFLPSFSNANCAFLKSLWDEKKFDESIVGWEDRLWHLELKDRYRFLYCPRAAVYHSHPFSFRYMLKRAYGDGKASRYIREKIGVDVRSDEVPSLRGLVRNVCASIKRDCSFLIRKRYYQYLLLSPVIKPALKIAYLRGLREKPHTRTG